MDTVERIFLLVDKKYDEQKVFAEEIGVPPQRVSEWRNRKSMSYQKKLPQIAKVLGTTVEYLLTGSAEKSCVSVQYVGDPVERIFRTMRQANISQQRLADALDISKDIVKSWKGKVSDSYSDYLPQLAEALNTTVDYLVTGSEIYRYPGSYEAFIRFTESSKVQQEIREAQYNSFRKGLEKDGLSAEQFQDLTDVLFCYRAPPPGQKDIIEKAKEHFQAMLEPYKDLFEIAKFLRTPDEFAFLWFFHPYTAELRKIEPDNLNDALSEIKKLYGELNEEGQEKLLDYADDLIASGKYKKSNPSEMGNEDLA